MAPRNPVLAIDGHAGDVDAEEMRRVIAALSDGAFGVVDGLAVTAYGTATRAVSVAPGGVLIPLTEPGLAGTGPVWGYNDAAYDVPFAVPGTNPRIDRVVASYVHGTKLWDIVPILGTEHPTTPVAPATPDNAVFLRDVRIDPSPADVVVAADITGSPTLARMHGVYAARRTPSTGRATASQTYVDWPVTDVLTKTIVKHRASSLLVVEVAAYWWVSTAIGRIDLAVQVNGVDHPVASRFANELSSSKTTAGFTEISGVPAGTHTVTLRAKAAYANAVINTNQDGTTSMKITEV